MGDNQVASMRLGLGQGTPWLGARWIDPFQLSKRIVVPGTLVYGAPGVCQYSKSLPRTPCLRLAECGNVQWVSEKQRKQFESSTGSTRQQAIFRLIAFTRALKSLRDPSLLRAVLCRTPASARTAITLVALAYNML